MKTLLTLGECLGTCFRPFFEDAYAKLFDGGSLLVPAVLPHIDKSVWSVMEQSYPTLT